MSRAGSTRLYRRKLTWWCWGYDNAGKRWSASTHQQDRRAAEVAAREIERERATAQANSPTALLWRALDNLIDRLEMGGRSTATIEIATQKGRHLRRLLGANTDLARLGAEQTRAYAGKRIEGGAKRHTVRKELGVLRQAMRASDLPWRAELFPDLGRVYVPRERWLKRQEYERLLHELIEDRRDYVTVWCHTGLRESELYRIGAEDIDVRRRQLRVRGTKTKSSARIVPLNPEALDVLARRATFDPWGKVGRDLRRACKRAEIEPVSPNDLRRTFASWLANASVSALVTAKLLGHTSTRMVEMVYARLGVEVQVDAVNRISVDGRQGVADVVAIQGDSTEQLSGARQDREKKIA